MAQILEAKFGTDCVLVGKAITLILMLAREFVFVFHEGASSYVSKSAEVARKLNQAGFNLKLNPILRASYAPWDALEECCAWLKLPEPLRRPFGTDELSAPSFAKRWRQVVAAQKETLTTLANLRRPLDLVLDLQSRVGGPWTCLASEYLEMQSDLTDLSENLADIKQKKQAIIDELRCLRPKRVQAEKEKGKHWRESIFERSPSDSELGERERLTKAVEAIDNRKSELLEQLSALQAQQEALVTHPDVVRCRERRAATAFEAELMRIRLIREAVVASEGLERSGFRPSAWWFPLVCPDGTWFRATMARAKYSLERLN
ncbi:hypothetical protein QM565_13115 [Geitlerinema splendidum]|nr:hypothetical protein [Geitlerinema splendidum]